MDEGTIQAVYRQVEKSQAALSKLMELICMVSAGSMAIIISMAERTFNSVLLRLSLLCMAVTCISVPLWYIGISRRSMKLVNEIVQNPTRECRAKEELWARVARIVAFAAFVLAELSLFLHWHFLAGAPKS